MDKMIEVPKWALVSHLVIDVVILVQTAIFAAALYRFW